MGIDRSIGFFCSVLATGVLASVSAEEIVKLTSVSDPDATLHIKELTIPPSDFWSPEYKTIYAKMLAGTREAASKPPQPDPHPARDAPKSEWGKFDARVNGYLAEGLELALKRYPAELTDTEMAGVHIGAISPKEGVAPENKGRVLAAI